MSSQMKAAQGQRKLLWDYFQTFPLGVQSTPDRQKHTHPSTPTISVQNPGATAHVPLGPSHKTQATQNTQPCDAANVTCCKT